MEMSEIQRALTVTYHPNPVSPPDGRLVKSHLWEEGETVRQCLMRSGIDPHQEIVISLNDRLLLVEEWDTAFPVPGDIVNVQVAVSGGGGGGSNPVQMVASIALMVVAPQLATSLYTAMGGTFVAANAGLMIAGMSTVISLGGNMLVGALFSPSAPKATATAMTGSGTRASPTYSLSGGSNQARPYEPMPVVLGRHLVFPDYASKPYTEYVGDDQYLYQVFNFGIGQDALISDLRIGDTPLSSFKGVEVVTQESDGSIPGFYGNVDMAAGAEITKAAGWISRTSSLDTTQLAIDLEYIMYSINKYTGGTGALTATFSVEYRPVGTTDWLPFTPDDVLAYSHYWSRGYWGSIVKSWRYNKDTGENVPDKVESVWVQVAYDNNLSASAHTDGDSAGTYPVKSKTSGITLNYNTTWRWIVPGSDPRPTGKFTYVTSTNTLTLSGSSTKTRRLTLKRQVDSGQYEVRMRRTSDDVTVSTDSASLSWTYLKSYQAQQGWSTMIDQKLLGVRIKASGQLNGMVQQLSGTVSRPTDLWTGKIWGFRNTLNPAWWYLHFLRGFYSDDGRLLYGVGLADTQIDIEAIKAWAAFCDREKLTFSMVLDQSQTCAETLQAICRVGFASPTWATGKLGVVWDERNQVPVMAFGMSNIIRGTFEVSYANENLAEEIIVPYVDAADGWKQKEVRQVVQGVVGMPKRTTRVEVPGLISNGVALKFCRHVAASQYYRLRHITWETDFEGFVCQRGDVVLLSHDLTQWGYSGRLVGVNGNSLTLDRAVPRSGSIDYLMLQRPDGGMTTHEVVAAEGDSDQLVLLQSTSLQEGYLPVDHKWFFSPLPTPGKKVKIVSIQPLSESRIRVTATDEVPEFYAAWDGVWNQPIKQTLLTDQSAVVTDIAISESIVPSGSGYYVQLNIVLSTEGSYGGAKVSYAINGEVLAEYFITGRNDTISVPSFGQVSVTVAAVDTMGRESSSLTATHNIIGAPAVDAMPEVSGLDIQAQYGQVSVMADRPNHLCFTGLVVYGSSVSGFTPGADNLLFQGIGNQVSVFTLAAGDPLSSITDLYLRVGYYSDIPGFAPTLTAETHVVMPPAPESKNLVLSASSQVFKKDKVGAVTPGSITITATRVGGLSGDATFSISTGTATLSGTGDSRTLASADMGTDVVAVTASVTDGVVTYSDTITIYRLSDGSNSVIAILSNEVCSLTAAASGSVTSYVGSGTKLRVYEGTTELTYDASGTSPGTWKATTTPTNIAVGALTDSGAYLTVGDHSGVASAIDSASVVYGITGKTLDGSAFSLAKTQTFSKSKAGAAGSTGLSALSLTCTNDSCSVPVSAAGAETWTGSGSLIYVNEGVALLTLSSNSFSTAYPATAGTYNLYIAKVSGNTLTLPSLTGYNTTYGTLSAWSGDLTQPTVYRIAAYVRTLSGATFTLAKDVTITPAFQGDPGSSGSPGSRGSITVYDVTTTSPTTAIAQSDICTRLGVANLAANLVPGDTVIFTKAPAASGTYYYNSSLVWVTNTLAIDGNVIVSGSLDADSLKSSTLSASKAITVGNSAGVIIEADSAGKGRIRAGQTAFNTGTGFFFGNEAGTPKMSIGNPSGKYLNWDGAALNVGGDIIATGNLVANAVSSVGSSAVLNYQMLSASNLNVDIITVTFPVSSTYSSILVDFEFKFSNTTAASKTFSLSCYIDGSPFSIPNPPNGVSISNTVAASGTLMYSGLFMIGTTRLSNGTHTLSFRCPTSGFYDATGKLMFNQLLLSVQVMNR